MQTVISGNYLTVEEAAEELGVSVGRVRQMLNAWRRETETKITSHEAKLPGKKFGKSWAISPKEVEKAKKIERKPGNPNFLSKST